MKFRYTKATEDLNGIKNSQSHWEMKLGIFDIKLNIIRKLADMSRFIEHEWNMWRLGY